MQQTLSTLFSTRACPYTREELAVHALGATVLFYTDGEPQERLRGIITFRTRFRSPECMEVR